MPQQHRVGKSVGRNSEFFREAVAGVIRDQAFAKDDIGNLYRYSHGRYVECRRWVRGVVLQFFRGHQRENQWNSLIAEEVIRFIVDDPGTPQLWARPPLDRLCVRDALLDLSDPEHPIDIGTNKQYLHSIQLPLHYNPKATCPAWERQIATLFPTDVAESGFVWKLLAWLMIPLTDIQKAVIIAGPPGTGKSTFLEMIRAFLGEENTSSVSLHALEKNRFAAISLAGKLANISSDLPTTGLDAVPIFKQITGGDTLRAEEKNTPSVEFRPFARLIFSTNEAAEIKRAEESVFDRWIVIQLEKRLRHTDQEISRSQLRALLASRRELSGVLNMALKYLPEVLKSGIRETPSMQKAAEHLRMEVDPVSRWLESHTLEDSMSVMSKVQLANAYNAWCARTDHPMLPHRTFCAKVEQSRPKLATVHRTINGRMAWGWAGIRLIGSEPEEDVKEWEIDNKEQRGSSE